MSHSSSTTHCTCCHLCHVSMKQRPRQLLACSDCNAIVCRTCLETRWKTNQWVDDPVGWVCQKCTGTCPCKSCRGKQSGGAVARAPKRTLEEEDDDFFVEEDVFAQPEALLQFKRPSRSAAPKVVTTTVAAPPAPAPVAIEAMGLGSFVRSSVPTHTKVLELSRKREHCQTTIANVQGLLRRLEEERRTLDCALDALIKESLTTESGVAAATAVPPSSPAASGGLKRSGSQASLSRSNSSCNFLQMIATLALPMGDVASGGVF